MEELTKENFWNELMEKYPEQVSKFCDWIDMYKRNNNWQWLFKGNEIKFHHLPIAMQFGIIQQFFAENAGWKVRKVESEKEIYNFFKGSIEQLISIVKI